MCTYIIDLDDDSPHMTEVGNLRAYKDVIMAIKKTHKCKHG